MQATRCLAAKSPMVEGVRLCGAAMEPRRPPASMTPGATMPAWREAGAIVRAARLRAGLTLADLGHRCGYSASQISRYERGVQPLTDVTLLRRFADALAIPHEMFGLAQPTYRRTGRHAEAVVNNAMHAISGPSVVRDFRREDGDDPVRRRELLAGAAGFASAAFLAPDVSREKRDDELSSGLEDLLYGRPAEPASLATLRAAIGTKREEFQTARYGRLSSGLSGLV